MTRFLRKALPLIATLAAGAGGSAASALTALNCTGTDIRVHVYDNADAMQLIARAGGPINPGRAGEYNVGQTQMALKIFQMGFIDQMRLSVSFVQGAGTYRVWAAPRGGWELQQASQC